MTARQVKVELEAQADPEKAAFFPRFFKTGPGEYGEGDRFIGVTVPFQRKIARRYRELPLDELEKLLYDPYHECRLTGLLILVEQYQRCRDSGARAGLCDFYLRHLPQVNNWDLVDSTAHKILGPQLESGNRDLLDELAARDHLWSQRVSVMATFHFIKNEDFDDTLRLCRGFLDHEHDLMHKICGWMLREVGKRDVDVLRAFLGDHHRKMPRTMLRYAIEKLDKPERQRWMATD